MKKKVLSMILAIAMVVSMFAGLATTASAAADATYTLVTDASTLQAGDIIVIALAAKGKAAGVKSGDYLTAVDGTFGDTLTSTDAVEFTLGGDATGWTLTSSEGTLGATAAKKLSYTGGTTTWTISITTDGAATIASTNSAYGRFLYNNGSPRFLNYASKPSVSMILPEIYKKTTATTPDCEHANTEERAEVAATCTEVGYTAGVFCTDCQTYISGHETIEALDHAWDEGVETLAATCTAAGKMTYTCTREGCGATKTEATPLAAHNYVDGTCTVCGAEKPADQNYALVTGAIAEGDYVIYYGGKAMNTTVASNRLQYLEVAPVNDVITNPDAAIVWHIAQSGDYWTIYNAAANSYAAATGKNNQATMNADGTADKSLWTITGEGAFDIVNKSNAAASGNAYLRNNGTYGFACYGTGTGGALTLYKLTDEVTCNHQYTYASNNNGTHTATCSLCDDTFTEACSGILTEEGGSEFECAKCGYMWTLDQYTMTTTVADGDHIIIYNATNKAALGAEASGTKLSGVSIPDSYVGTTTILAADGVAVLTVADYADGQFHLVYNDQYLTAPATGNGLSFAAAAAEGETDYALWTIVDGQYIKNVNAAYNTKEIYLEYFSGFTSYSAGTDTKFQMTIYSDNVACTHTSTKLVGAVAATCITSGYSGDTVCADCGATITAGAEIPALGHNFVDGKCDRCSATQLTATNVTSLTDGAKVYIYNAASGYVLTGTAARAAGYFAGVPSTVEGDVLTTSSDALLLTVHVVEGGYKFENNGLYLTYGDDRTTLSLAEDSDHAVWALDASYHLISVNDNYLFNGEASDLYLQTYTKAGGFTCYATSNLTDYFVLSFYDPSAAVCEHVWNAGEATTPATCVDAGVMTYTCTLCGVTKTEVIEATGVHTYGDDHVCTVCGAVDVAAFDFSGNYYIATMRATGNYFWMTNDTSTGTRYTAVDSGLTELPSEITSDVDAAKVWTLEKQEDGTYLLSSNGMYSTWSSGNTAAFGEPGLALTLAKTGDIFTISFVSAEPATRYLSLNATTGNNYFAFYKGSQKQELSLIPVAAETPVTHTALYFEGQAATCTTDGVVAYWYCAECLEDGEHYGKCYSDEAMTTEIAAENLVIAALGHSAVTDAAVAPTCTETGLTEGSHCSVCGETIVAQEVVPATGHNWVEATEGENYVAPTCTETGLAYMVCSVCGEVGAGRELPALGHDMVAGTVHAPTCTEEGYTEYVCSRCGADDMRDIVSALGHSYTYADNGDGTHTVTCSVCGDTYTEEHSFTDGSCVCGATEVEEDLYLDSALVFYNKSLSLESSIKAQFIIKPSNLTGYTDFYVSFNHIDPDGKETTTTDTGYVYYKVYKVYEMPVAAKEMSDTIQVTLYGYKNGQWYHGETVEWIVRDALVNGLRNSTKDSYKVLAASILNYGAAAQNFFSYNTDNLANATLTEEELALAITTPDTLHNNGSTSGTAAGVSFVGKTLALESAIEMQFIFSSTKYKNTQLEAHVSYTLNGETKTDVIDGSDLEVVSGKYYTLRYSGIAAKDLRTVVTVTIYDKTTGNAVSQSISYSAETYCYEKLNSTSTTAVAKAMCTAVMCYIDAAAAYFG